MKATVLISLRLLTVLTVITGIVYPLTLTVFAFLAFPERSQGSIIFHHGAAVGSAVIGQRFASPKYFHGRASSGGYDPMASGASNMGQTSLALRDSVAARRTQFARENMLSSGDGVPPDMLSASGSGLDPEISPNAALLQIGRIAAARNFDRSATARLTSLVHRSTQTPELGFLGQPRVNVLLLNLELDEMSQ